MPTNLRRNSSPISFRPQNLEDVDRLLRSFGRRIQELEDQVASRGVLLRSVEIGDGERVVLRHGLGRDVAVFVSPVWDGAATSGRVERFPSDSTTTMPDERNYAVVGATGFGATVKVDVWFM